MKQRLKQAAGNQIQPPSTFLENVPIVIGGQHKVTVCMVQKVGSSRFKLLFLRRMGYTPDTLLGPGHAINPHEGYLIGSPTTMPSYISELLDAQRQRILIVRSPYARVLSAFLNKVRKNIVGSLICQLL